MNLNDIKSELLDIRIFCGRHFPFIIIPLSYTKIIVSKQIPTAGVNQNGHLIINPTWWNNLTIEAKRFTIIHETLHLALCHPFRAYNFNPQLYNIAADAKVNHAIDQTNLRGIRFPTDDIVTLHSIAIITKLPINDLLKMSTEEITKIIENNHPSANNSNKNNPHNVSNGFSEDLLKGEFDGEILQEGDLTLNTFSQEKLGDAWRQVCEKAKTFAKQAGTLSASFERLVDEVLEVKPPWQTRVRFGLHRGLVCDSSFAYPNRRSNDLPGHVGYFGTVWCLIDTSGSIGQELLREFLGIVKHEARQVSLRVMPWDTDVYEVIKVDHPSEVACRVASKLKGGGGTTCLLALQKVYKLLTPGDAVIILTDGYIFDAEKQETQQWFTKIANKTSFAMIGYTQKPINPPGFKSAHLTL